MQKPDHNLQNVTPLRLLPQQSMHQPGSRRSQIATTQQSFPSVFPEKRGQVKASGKNEVDVANEDPKKLKKHEHRIDIGDEQSDLLGYEVFSGKLAPYKKSMNTSAGEQSGSATGNRNVDAKLTSKALVWGSQMLPLEDVISVSYNAGLRHFTVNSFPIRRRSCGLRCFLKPQRQRKDYCFLSTSSEEAVQWVRKFADQQCYINCLPHPMTPNKQTSDVDIVTTTPIYDQPYVKCKNPPKVLVILNPRSGHGRSSRVFHGKVEPIFRLAGFMMEVVKTTSAGHAKNLASTVDFSTCPDGIICVGGDGLVNEILNGLLSRADQKEAVSIPIGIIPAGSDNSLVWTVLGVRDPISAAITIVKGGLTATDVFAVEWIRTGVIHFGTTVTYFGFLSDVLELSEKYQKRFGPLRYFVAGFLKFLCLPKYSYEMEYLPMSKNVSDSGGNALHDEERIDMPDLYTDIVQMSSKEGIPRASSLSSIDSIMTPSRMSGVDLDTAGGTHATSEPSDYVRCLDPKSKRLSLGRSSFVAEPEEVLHPQHHLSATPSWPRTRSKSRADKSWTGLTSTNDSRSSWAATSLNDKEDISSTISDPGPIWDSEPKWDSEPNWEAENPIQLPERADDVELATKKELVPNLDDKWIVKKGQFLGVLVCNHSCKTVQSLSSQVIAPKAEHDDNCLDMLLIHGSGRMRLLSFLIRLQLGKHLSLPFVEYVKVKSVKLKPGKGSHNGCGIDGELLPVNEQVICSLLPEQCRLIGRHPARD